MGVPGGTCILGGAELKDRPVASSISTGMTEERDGVISDMGVLLDRVRRPWVLLSRDQEPDPSKGLEGHHLAVANAPFGLLWVADRTNHQPNGACF